MSKRKQALPETFEELAAKVEPKQDVRPIGGMELVKWSGVDMWRCPRCHGTTFHESQAKVHTCKVAKFADEADE